MWRSAHTSLRIVLKQSSLWCWNKWAHLHRKWSVSICRRSRVPKAQITSVHSCFCNIKQLFYLLENYLFCPSRDTAWTKRAVRLLLHHWLIPKPSCITFLLPMLLYLPPLSVFSILCNGFDIFMWLFVILLLIGIHFVNFAHIIFFFFSAGVDKESCGGVVAQSAVSSVVINPGFITNKFYLKECWITLICVWICVWTFLVCCWLSKSSSLIEFKLD